MGTRGFTGVVKGGEFKIAQYGQFDHYLVGQGQDALDFLNTAGNIDALRVAVDEIIYPSEEEIEAAYASVGAEDGWLTMDQSNAFDRIYPAFTRNHGAKILDLVANQHYRELHKNETFPYDSLFCEYAYVVDLDNNVFEVYAGFQESPGKGRFTDSDTTANKNGYWPVTLIGSFPLDDLPKEFADDTEPVAVYADGREVSLA